MRKLVLIVAGVLLNHTAASAVLAQGSDSTKTKASVPSLEGKWRGSVTTPNGNQDVNCEIRKEKDGFVGTISGVEGDVPLRNIVVEGDKVTAGAVMSMQGTSFEVWYSFVLKGDALTGTVSASFNGESMSFDLVLKRVTDR